MNNSTKVLLWISCIFLFSCTEVIEEKPKMFPSDYLFAQRSFPSGEIDQDAWLTSLRQVDQLRNDASKNFNEKWKSHGPLNYCGRITDIEMPPEDLVTIYAGSASGGIFKSTDQGTNWKPIFDKAKSLSIGDLAIYQKDPNIIYAGTGESNAGGGSLAYDGVGVYRSDDAGDNWTELGPNNIGSIGKIAIDPNDPDRLYVAAMGSLFANNPERGVYRSEDAGLTWENVLMVSDSTGAIDLAIHPSDGNIIYASMWERIRRPYGRQYGGVTSGLYKSEDGGDSWIELTNGLPQDPDQKGRIGLTISPSDPDILYAFYAAANGNIAGVFKTEDAGMSWTSKSIDGIDDVPYIWWFGKIFIHPTDPDQVIVTSLNLSKTNDGGASWEPLFVDAHVDHHAIYIHPQTPELILNGNDGGVNLGVGQTPFQSEYLSGLNNFQFYTCEIDPNNPSILYGGSQDNGTNRIIANSEDWERIFGGDGFRVQIDPTNSNQIYLEFQYGNIFVSSDGGDVFQRATSGISGASNWNTPLVLDPNFSNVVYTGTDRLYKSNDRAGSWNAISPKLVNDDNPVGNLDFGTLTTIDVSELDSDVIYVGTDDGNVWVTKDGGDNFLDVSNGIPERWITSVQNDPWLDSGVYLTVSGFRFGESDAQVFYSDNYGSTWKAIGTDLPDVPVNDIVIDDLLKDVLYLATDIGVFYSDDKGEKWTLMGLDLPNVPILDLDFDSQSRTLAAASFGRGMFSYELPLNNVSTEESELNNQVVIGPNPCGDYFEVFTDQDIRWICIYNIEGKKIMQSGPQKTLDVSLLKTGFYIVQIRTENGMTKKALVKS